MNQISKTALAITFAVLLFFGPLGYKIYKGNFQPKENFTIELTYIDGYVETKTYNLNKDSEFYVQTSKGSYSLQTQYVVVAPGVIRYKLIK
ncbi:hypothetical protein MA9V2_229 [Chryseobacterium phage MA9V-2]|nr:hypothetical protein MA9V2_229 [Chryseobacterium phage MA9V-2]